ncbi:penicillin-binding transpeptidase domain-containing protein [Planctomycetota bacterium]
MFSIRMKVFLGLSALLLMTCLVRLTQLQLIPNSALQKDFDEIKNRRQKSHSLKTLRGDILDRKGQVIASDEPIFQLLINYRLAQYADWRVVAAKELRIKESDLSETAKAEAQADIQTQNQQFAHVMRNCAQLGVTAEALTELQSFNNMIWNLRVLQVWRSHKACDSSPLRQSLNGDFGSIKAAEYVPDFRNCIPDPNKRLLLVEEERILEMQNYCPLFNLTNDEDVLAAQFMFKDMTEESDNKRPLLKIVPQAVRKYPNGRAAAQTIGWVGRASDRNKALFAHDPNAKYLDGEVSGREDGIEYVCEPLLRGRRGRLVYNLDQELIGHTQSQFGRDIRLTLDIKLQQEIEQYLIRYKHQPYCGPGMAAVVLDVVTGDILALVSLPLYDPGGARAHIDKLFKDSNEPTINRCLNKHYKPGSTAKPVILIAGLETGHTTPERVISCPGEKAPPGWPSCWIWRSNQAGHDWMWSNTARNAIKGSCNIYFSHLCVEIPREPLQRWLFNFGFGHQVPLPYLLEDDPNRPGFSRRLRQAPGKISHFPVKYGTLVTDFNDIPRLLPNDRRLVGIGEGEFNATLLQIANSMATLARQGIHITPCLFLPKPDRNGMQRHPAGHVRDLNISEETMAIVMDGLYAVVNETGGTAHDAFGPAGFSDLGITVYGKTGSTQAGSTQDRENALFAGFARDMFDNTVALALVIEGGQHGSSDAAPLARDIFDQCIKFGYLIAK